MMFPNKNNQMRSLRYGIGNQDLPKTNLVNALRYGTQLGSDFLTGSSISEALGYRPDVIKGQGYTPSYRDQFNTTVDLLRQGKTTEGLVKGAETLLTGTGAVGEGMMLGSAIAGPLAPLLLGAGFVVKGLSKSGKLILQSKTGKKILANFTGDKTQGFNVTDIELPKNDTSPEIQTLEDNIDIPTIKTENIDTKVAIPEIAQDLNTTEAITGYIVAPDKLDRDQLISKIENDPEVKIKTDKYLKDIGITGDTIPIYRYIAVLDKVKRRLGFNPFPEIIKKAEIGEESIVSGSLSPTSNLKSIDFFEPKIGINAKTEIVRYDVPRDRIKLAMGGFKNDIKQNVNKKLKEKGFGQNKILGQTVTNPSKTAKDLIDMQEEIIADVSGLEKKVLTKGPSINHNETTSAAKKIIKGEIKTIEDYKNYKGSSYIPLTRDEMKGLSQYEFDVASMKALENEVNKITDFYGLPRLGVTKQDEGNKTLKEIFDEEYK